MLVDRDELIDSILLLNPTIQKPSTPQIIKSVSINDNSTCSKCGSPMVLKQGKEGSFWGAAVFRSVDIRRMWVRLKGCALDSMSKRRR